MYFKLLERLNLIILKLIQSKMGGSACCGKNHDDPNNITTDFLNKEFKSKDKLALIIKIQSRFRGFLARKKVHSLKHSQLTQNIRLHSVNKNGVINYDNQDV